MEDADDRGDTGDTVGIDIDTVELVVVGGGGFRSRGKDED